MFASGQNHEPGDEEWMQRAIEVCRRGIADGQTPFGTVIVRDGRLVAECHNTVWRDTDPTAHAEVNALRAAAHAIGSIDLSGAVLYSTCEPCPMCLAASHWAKIGRLVFGASIDDAQHAGFTELTVSAARLAAMGGSPMIVVGGVLRDDCAELFRTWQQSGNARIY